MRREWFAVARLLAGMICLLCVAAPKGASAHALWTDPKPRDNVDGYKPPPRNPGFVLPCGVARAPSQPVTKLKAGENRMVAFRETVPHPGCFLIEFAKSDTATFERLKVVKRTKTGAYTTDVMLPGEACTGCVLRLRQVMLANDNAACPPAVIDDLSPTLYYSCANIELETGAGGSGGAGGQGGVAGAGGGTAGQGGGGAGGQGGGGAAGQGGSGGGGAGGQGQGGSGGMTASNGGSGGRGGGSGAGGSVNGGRGGSDPVDDDDQPSDEDDGQDDDDGRDDDDGEDKGSGSGCVAAGGKPGGLLLFLVAAWVLRRGKRRV